MLNLFILHTFSAEDEDQITDVRRQRIDARWQMAEVLKSEFEIDGLILAGDDFAIIKIKICLN